MNQVYTPSQYESRTWDKENQKWLDNEPQYKVKVTKFLDKSVKLVMRTCTAKKTKERFYGMMTSYQKELTDEQKEAKRLENVERSARRAKQAVHHLIRQIGADHMLTLSTRENITDKDKFFEIFARFIRLVRTTDYVHDVIDGHSIKTLKTRKEKREYFYVATPELQERGAYHMHIACVGKQDLNLLRACWYTALGGHPSDTGHAVLGQIDVQSDKKRFSGYTETHKTFKLVNYLTKYVTKSFQDSDLLGQKRYSSSRGIPKPQTSSKYLVANFSCPETTFIEAAKELYRYAELELIRDLTPWNRGLDVFILTGVIHA